MSVTRVKRSDARQQTRVPGRASNLQKSKRQRSNPASTRKKGSYEKFVVQRKKEDAVLSIDDQALCSEAITVSHVHKADVSKAKNDQSAVLSEKGLELAIAMLCKANNLPLSRARTAVHVLLGHKKIPELQIGSSPSSAEKSEIIWPTEKYSYAPEKSDKSKKGYNTNKTGESIVEFLQRVWRDAVAAGATRTDLRRHDPSADVAISNYLRPTKLFPLGRELPPEVRFPTLKQVNTQKLATVSISELSRLASAARRRGMSGP